MVDPERVRSKFGTLEADLHDLSVRQDVGKQNYRADRDLQAIVERRFQACLDVTAHVVAAEGYREPADYGDLFRILEDEGVVSSEVADRMVEMAGFRNVLAHRYATIDHERVYEQLQDIDHFRQFVREQTTFIEEHA